MRWFDILNLESKNLQFSHINLCLLSIWLDKVVDEIKAINQV